MLPIFIVEDVLSQREPLEGAIKDCIVKKSADEVISRIKTCVKITFYRYLQSEVENKEELVVVVGSKRRKIPFKELCFLEVSSAEQHLSLHTTTGKIEFRGYMKEIEKKNPSLTRVHRAYLVNLNNARSFDGKRRILEMVNGGLCRVSARKVNTVKKALDLKHKEHKPANFENTYYI